MRCSTSRVLAVVAGSEETRGPSDEFRMQFEALTQFDDHEKLVARELLDSLILKHTANQLTNSANGHAVAH